PACAGGTATGGPRQPGARQGRRGAGGEPLYGKLEPTGYPNTGDAWANTAGILGRINFASAFAAGQIAGVRVDVSRFNFKDPQTLAREMLNVPPSASTMTAIEHG